MRNLVLIVVKLFNWTNSFYQHFEDKNKINVRSTKVTKQFF